MLFDSTARNTLDNQQQGSQHKLLSIDLTGPRPGSGKTHLLYWITTLAVLPRHHDTLELAGQENTLVFVDCDGKFDVQRLYQIMFDYILFTARKMDGKIKILPSDISRIARASLDHVHVFRPRSLESTISTIGSIPEYLIKQSSPHKSACRKLHSIIVDGASTFLWQHKAKDESSRFSYNPSLSRTQPKNTRDTNALYGSLVSQLSSVAAQLSCAVLTTSHATYQDVASPDSQRTTKILRSIMPPCWTTFFALRIVVDRIKWKPYPMMISREEAIIERTARLERVNDDEVEGEKFEVSCSNLGVQGNFRFLIGRNGMEMLA